MSPTEFPDPASPAGPIMIGYAGDGGPPPARKKAISQLLIICGLIAIGFMLIVAFVLPNLGRAHEPSKRAKCANNLRQIALACHMYADDHGGKFPDTLNEVLLTQEIVADVFVCPSSNGEPAAGATTQQVVANLTAPGHLSYVYVGKGLTSDALDTTVLAYELASNHAGGSPGMNIVYADAHVKWQDAKTATAIVADLQAGHNPPGVAGK